MPCARRRRPHHSGTKGAAGLRAAAASRTVCKDATAEAVRGARPPLSLVHAASAAVVGLRVREPAGPLEDPLEHLALVDVAATVDEARLALLEEKA